MKNINAGNRLSCQQKKKNAHHVCFIYHFEMMFPIPSLLQGEKEDAELDYDPKTAVDFPARLRERNARYRFVR